MGNWDSTDADGMNGAFSIKLWPGATACCIVSDGSGLKEIGLEIWEHVSVHMEDGNGKERTPSWGDMCLNKDIFWNEDEVVVQFHPAKKDYVNLHPHVLHLWRRAEGFPTPPKVCV